MHAARLVRRLLPLRAPVARASDRADPDHVAALIAQAERLSADEVRAGVAGDGSVPRSSENSVPVGDALARADQCVITTKASKGVFADIAVEDVTRVAARDRISALAAADGGARRKAGDQRVVARVALQKVRAASAAHQICGIAAEETVGPRAPEPPSLPSTVSAPP